MTLAVRDVTSARLPLVVRWLTDARELSTLTCVIQLFVYEDEYTMVVTNAIRAKDTCSHRYSVTDIGNSNVSPVDRPTVKAWLS